MSGSESTTWLSSISIACDLLCQTRANRQPACEDGVRHIGHGLQQTRRGFRLHEGIGLLAVPATIAKCQATHRWNEPDLSPYTNSPLLVRRDRTYREQGQSKEQSRHEHRAGDL